MISPVVAAFRRRRKQRHCFHHDRGGNPANSRPAVSWIKEQLVDLGRRKMFSCDDDKGCGKTWIA